MRYNMLLLYLNGKKNHKHGTQQKFTRRDILYNYSFKKIMYGLNINSECAMIHFIVIVMFHYTLFLYPKPFLTF